MVAGARAKRLVWSLVLLAGVTASRPLVGATDKRVHGIITAMDGGALTISSAAGKKAVTGRIDASRTKVVLDGKPAGLGDLRITYLAHAELGLDDVWQKVQAGTK